MFKYKRTEKINALPSLMNKSGHHWAVVEKARKQWHKWVDQAFMIGKPSKPISHCKLSLVRATANVCDYDNLVISFKPVVDGLVKAGIIADDDFQTVVDRHYSFLKVPRKEAHILITVEEL
jgi:hypothetical protein